MSGAIRCGGVPAARSHPYTCSPSPQASSSSGCNPRTHRAGEGAAFTGLKPAGRDVGPAIPAADKALQTGEVGPVVDLVTRAAAGVVKEKFRHARELSGYPKSDVEAGRRYVEAYVSYLHAVERMYHAATHAPAGHAEEVSTAGEE